MSDRAEKAVSRYMRGYNCARAVSSVFTEDTGVLEEFLLRVSTGFGSGMGYTGGSCGAVSGAVLVIGLSCGGSGPDDQEAKDLTYARTREFINRFTQKNGATTCTELLGCDLSTEEGLARAREQNLPQMRCPGYVRDAVEILEELLQTK